MKTLGYYNGKYDEIDKIMIPMSDRSHWFGDGVYDATCARNYKIMAIDYCESHTCDLNHELGEQNGQRI